MRHEPEAARREREVEGWVDHVATREPEHRLDRYRRRPFDQRDHVAEEAVDATLVDGKQQLVLAREVQVDGTLGEARLVGDLGDVEDAVG